MIFFFFFEKQFLGRIDLDIVKAETHEYVYRVEGEIRVKQIEYK